LSESGRRLLHRDGDPRLSAASKTRSSRRGAASVDSWDGVDRGLFEALRTTRSAIASQRNVPAYVVFGDATLRELARVRPSTLAGFANIKGVGERKLADFGELFLAPLLDYCASHDLETDVAPVATAPPPAPRVAVTNANSLAAFEHFRRGESLAEVAEKLGRAVSTVSGYLQDYLRHEKITDPAPWVDAPTRDAILGNLHRLEAGRMKPLYEFFAGQISYDAIRIVLACHRNVQAADETLGNETLGNETPADERPADETETPASGTPES
ncbi:MAG: HRDC domain-containing protein, partial [Novipirellula sp. JB048]